MNNVVSIILGGGGGTRLQPLTRLRAKPAVPLAGKYRLIDIPISNSINSGVHRIYVLTQFNSASLNRHVNKTYSFSPFQQGFVEILAAQLTPERADWFQGTADAVRQYLTAFKAVKADQFIILSGDHLYQMDYSPFIEHHRQSGADITLSVLPVSREKASDFGLIKIDNNGQVLEFNEKPKGKALDKMAVDTTLFGIDPEQAREKPFIASMGIYVFNRQTLFDLLTEDPEKHDFGKQLIPDAIDKHRIQTYLFQGYWEDIGTIRSFFEANIALTKFPAPDFSFFDISAPVFTRQRFLPPSKIVNTAIEKSMISEGCILEGAAIRHSVIGVRTIIGNNSTLENTLMMGADFFQSHQERSDNIEAGIPPIGVGANCRIKRAIIDKNARIGRNVQLINKEGIQEGSREDEGIWIKGGIIVIAKNTIIPDGTIV